MRNIGLDITGGDFAPHSTVAGAMQASLEVDDDVVIHLIGDEKVIQCISKNHDKNPEKIKVIHSTEVIGMSEHPTRALSQKKNSSMAIGFDMLANGDLDSFASVGNTGAMMVGAMYSVEVISGILRPCITSILPREDGSKGVVLDVGTNADCKPEVLKQFAILGSLYAQNYYDVENPKVGLLNIGEEDGKGNLLTQATFPLLEETPQINFVGNIDARYTFSNKADVLVCDGFTGNIVLKCAEAIHGIIERRGLMDDYFSKFDYEIYGGTPVLGVNSNVVIGHGISNANAIKNILMLSQKLVRIDLPTKIKDALSVL